MNGIHHPSLDLRRRFALGTLGPPFDFAVSAHLDACPECRRSVEGFELVGATLTSEIAPVALSDGALQATLARLDTREPAPRSGAPMWLPPSLQGHRLGPEFPVGPGVWLRRVWTGRRGRGRVYLLRARAGSELPRHDHCGVEITCVLKGGYSDENGPHVTGDCFTAREGHAHTPRVDDDGECVCLIATDAPPKAEGLPGLVMRALL